MTVIEDQTEIQTRLQNMKGVKEVISMPTGFIFVYDEPFKVSSIKQKTKKTKAKTQLVIPESQWVRARDFQ
ncbi:MAG: hypothetical protein GTO02_22320 [Candidatus Dadabacteria bacterium]|nr:hypothetical protein [Candidatus Dadabacteria bacterium]